MKKYKILLFHKTGLSCGSIRDEDYISEAFQELGHTIFTNNTDRLLEVDLVLVFKDNSITPQMINEWRTKTKAPIWFFSFDNMDRHPQFYPIIEQVDLWLGEDLSNADRFKESRIPFYYFPNHASSPKKFHPIDLPKAYNVSFTGTPYFQERIDMLKAVENAGIDLHIFGNNPDGWKNNGFKNVHNPVFDEELSKIVSQSKIMIGINSSRNYGMWSIRPIQVMLCGGFMIEQYVLGMERELRDGCEYWDTYKDIIEKIRYYLEHEDERLAIAKRGYEIATTTLTNKSRCAELIVLFEQYTNKKNNL